VRGEENFVHEEAEKMTWLWVRGDNSSLLMVNQKRSRMVAGIKYKWMEEKRKV